MDDNKVEEVVAEANQIHIVEILAQVCALLSKIH